MTPITTAQPDTELLPAERHRIQGSFALIVNLLPPTRGAPDLHPAGGKKARVKRKKREGARSPFRFRVTAKASATRKSSSAVTTLMHSEV